MLRKAAVEIAANGHCGWGNACTYGADTIAALQRELAAVTAERDAKDKQLAECYDRMNRVEIEAKSLREALEDIAEANDVGYAWERARSTLEAFTRAKDQK